ncbi:OmpH family outer membrane protein [Ilyomonas limi]|uniref:OmpH family outer membrane protein n=1 Tax=Ilyomonas limi TaxID=2575867 RepID=A0A4U3KWA8_9BACT|nr:OmpH family outer membrane protein [Ilyomonas limi]TKK65327.1 OmpH family outer membrane protein [Ilyomonas limi]
MNKVLLILNVILIAAVGFLYYTFSQYRKEDQQHVKEANAAVANSFKIAYFELDSLQEHYTYFKEVREELNKQEAQRTKQLDNIRTSYMNKLKEYNQKGATMSQTDQSNFEQELRNLQNNYEQRQQELGQEMNTLYMQKMQNVKQRIQDFLKTYCKSKGYAYVFATSSDDYLYYKDTLRNITPDIVGLLNDEYKTSKKGK